MRRIDEARIGQVYYVQQTAADQKLRDLGFVKGKEVVLSNLTELSGIVQVAGSRLALDREILHQIFISEEESEELLEPLSDLVAGQTGLVRKIETDPATKRRLMDMGITRGVDIYVRKLAPMGDPMELHLRGYALSLRKEDAQLIRVVRGTEDRQ